MVCGVSVTSANVAAVAPSTVTHGQNRISRATFGDVLPLSVSTERHLTATIVDLNVPTLRFLLSRIEERAIQKLRGKGARIEL